MTISNLQDKFVFELGAMRDAEERFLEGQQVMLEQAGDERLRQMLEEHIVQTEQQIETLDEIFAALGVEPLSNKCDAANGLVMEGSKTMAMTDDSYVRDCVIVGMQAKVEHFEVACYRCLVRSAEMMGQGRIADLLEQNMAQEEQTAIRIEQATPQLIQAALQGETAMSGAA
jgi:ferritin-like metal-binding protein YciE